MAIATISVDMQTALSAATFFNLCKRRANDRRMTSIVNSGFAEKSRLNNAKRRQTAVVSPCWLVDTGNNSRFQPVIGTVFASQLQRNREFLKSRESFIFSVIYFQCFAKWPHSCNSFLRTLGNEAHKRLWARKFLRGSSDSETSIIFGQGAISAKPRSTRDYLEMP